MQATNGPQITKEILEQNPLLAAYLILVMGVVTVAAIGSFATWGFVFYRRSLSQAILPLTQPWEPRRWAFTDLIVLGVTFVTFQLVFASLASQFIQIEKNGKLSLEIAAAGGVGSLAAVIFGTAGICLRYRANLSHLGFGAIKLRTIAVGVMGGLLSLPLLYVLMGLVSAASKSKYSHPLVNSASESGQFQTYLLGFFAAAIAAPIFEEFFFRVILQGWLQSIPFKSFWANFVGSMDLVKANPAEGQPPYDASEIQSEPFSGSAANTGASAIRNIYASPADISSTVESSAATQEAQKAVPPIWPSIITGLLFGFAHFEYGVSFIPLSFLGIFLGLIYRQTHSIWPCIIIHMMLNSFSMMMLGLIILMKQAGVSVE